MKRINIFTVILLAVLLLMNLLSILNINQRFVSFLNSSLEQQTNVCGKYMEQQLEDFENDLNKLLFRHHFSSIFNDADTLQYSEKSLQVFYSKYRELITNVFVFDNDKNYYGLYINNENNFAVDTFSRQRQQQLSARDKLTQKDGKYLYHYPYFENDQVSGNIIVEVDFNRFAKKVFTFYPPGKTISWQWVVNSDGEMLTNDFPDSVQVNSLDIIADSIVAFSNGLINHTLYGQDNKKQKIHSAYYPMSIFDQKLGIVFSASQSDFYKFFINQNILVSMAAFIITLLLIVYLLIIITRMKRTQEKLMMSENVFRQITEKLPVGIMILDAGGIIRNINSTAQRLMFISKKENLIGKDYSKQFLLTNKYLLRDSTDSFDTSDYLFYEKDGSETVIFRIEEKTRIEGEELRLIAMMDVSQIERSRKQEVAANRAKSDFLATMSHEIRTPMNGILGMVSSLMDSDLDEQKEEKVRIIKKSSDLLMTIINDILDFSKIEAGKMMLEEIPFRLREEISLVIDLFRPLAEEKGLQFESDITTSVPDKLIGDPFRLRQVISNLVSNAIKFTDKGRIVIGTKVMENYRGRMQLLFWVEDTGIGIPEEKIGSIFGSYAQTGGSISRKFGGTGLGTTISKQLVELMNGEIWVESPARLSSPDGSPGSRFSFTIEVYSNEKKEKKYNYEGISKLSQITILYLTKEPNPEKNSVTLLLKKFGINIVTKIYQDSTIDTVMHHLNVKQDLYQTLVIADKNKLDGFTLANKLKEEGLMEKFPSIMVTNNDQPGNFKISKRLDIDYYLVEPFESKELFDIIQEIFSGLQDKKSIEPILNTLPAELSILLVEDNVINQKVAQSIFKSIGYEIEIASNGSEAIEKTRQQEYDIIFMDLFMPEVDGFEATETIRRNGVKTPIIAMSADTDDQRKAKSVIAGMDDYLSKPAKMETVKKLLIKMFSVSVK